MTYKEIEKLTEKEAKNMAIESLDIKGYKVYLAVLDQYYGFSALVYAKGKPIHYANEYSTHYSKEYSQETLKKKYVDSLNKKLFLDEEILYDPISSYEDCQNKEYYIRNYLPMQYDNLSMFVITSDKKQVDEYNSKIKNYPYPCKGCFAHFKTEEPVIRINELLKALYIKKELKANDYEYYYNAFLSEMYNHEYLINWDADLDTLSAFGLDVYGDSANYSLDYYFELLNFNETQKKAYIDARNYIMKHDVETENNSEKINQSIRK